MNPIRPSGVTRRVLLSSLATLPVLAGALDPVAAQTATSGGLLPSWNDGPAKQAILDFVRATTDQVEPELRRRRRTASPPSTRTARCGSSIPMYTQVIYCLDRVPAVAAKKPELEERRAVQDRAVRRPRGDREALDAGPREDPRRDAHRHDGRGVQRRSEEVARDGQASALEAALHRAHLSADARSAALPARQRLQDLHRHRRRPGLRARLRRAGLRHPARAGGRHRGRDEVRLRQGRQAVPDQGAEAPSERQQRRQAGGHPPHDRPPALCGVRQLDRRPADAGIHRRGRRRAADDAGAARRRRARIRLRPGRRGCPTPRSAPSPRRSTTRRRRTAGR